MKRFILLVVAAVMLLPNIITAQNSVKISITDMDNVALSRKMGASASALLSELNRAYDAGTTPNLTRIDMSNEARQNILQIWNNSHFRSVERELYLRCLNTNSGFQVRNIPFIMKEGGGSQDVVINFAKSGSISSFYFAIENHRYQSIMGATNSVIDLRRRQMILNFIENFRTAYNRKDTPLISDMYSDHALIITGTVYTVSNSEVSGLSEERVRYFKQNKEEYMVRLKNVFAANKYVNVNFDDINIVQHPKHPDIYGVTLKQAWRTSNYNDDGWLFLAIHFETDEKMYVDVRTWQPYMLNGEVLPSRERFTLGDLTF